MSRFLFASRNEKTGAQPLCGAKYRLTHNNSSVCIREEIKASMIELSPIERAQFSNTKHAPDEFNVTITER